MNFATKTLVQLTTRGATLVLGLLTSKWLITFLSPGQYREYSLITDFLTGWIIAIITFGIPQFIYRFYSNSDLDKLNLKTSEKFTQYWSTMMFLRGISFLVGIFLMFVGLYFLKIDNFTAAILVFTAQFIMIADQSFRSITDATGRSHLYGITDFVAKFLIVFLLYFISYLMKITVDLAFLGIILIIGNLFSFILDSIFNFKFFGFGKINFTILKESFPSIFQFTLISLLSFLYIASFPATLNYFQVDNIEYGSFVNAYFRIFFAVTTFATILIPNVATAFKKSLETKNKTQLYRSVQKLLFIILGSYLICIFAGPVIIYLIDSGTKYYFTFNYLLYLTPVMGIYVLNYFIFSVTTLFHKEKNDLLIVILLLFFSILLQFILIPTFGAFGAVLVFNITMVLDFILKFRLFYSVYKSKI